MTGGGPDHGRRHGRFYGAQGGQRDWDGHDQMAERQALRVLAGAQSQQPHHRWEGHEAQRPSPAPTGPRRHCVWLPTGCTAPTAPWGPSCAGRKHTWEHPRPSPPRLTSWPASSAPCFGAGRLTRMPARSTAKRNIVKERCAPPSGGQRNWATSLSRHPMKWVIPAEAGIWSRNPTILDFG